jgi:uncharacterized protein involved in exopolysaccharide biosynthesis
VALHEQDSDVSRACADIFRTIFLDKTNADGKTFLFTSAVEAEGKTTMALHFAAMLATKGKRVLLVDVHWRRPSLSRFFGIAEQPGLTDLIESDGRHEDPLVQDSRLPQLFVLPRGTRNADLLDSVAHERLGAFLQRVRGEFDFILLDAAPTASGPEVLIFNPMVDGVLLVVASIGRNGRWRRRARRKTCRQTVGVILVGYPPPAYYRRCSTEPTLSGRADRSKDMETPTPQIEYLQYVWLVTRKQKWMMAAIALTTFAAVQFFGYLVTPVWEGTTMLLVERTSKQNLSVFREVNIPVAGTDSGGDVSLDLIPLLTGSNMGYDVVRQFHLDELMREKRYNPPALRDVIKNLIVDIAYSPLYLIRGWEEPNWTDRAAEEFVEDWIDIKEEEGTGIINLTVYGESPQQAADVANGMAELLEQRTQEFSRSRASAAYEFSARQVEEAEANLRNAEEDIARFQEASGLYGPDESRRLLVQNLDQLRTELVATRRLQEEVDSSLLGALESQTGAQFLQANIALSPVVRQIETNLVALNVRRSALLLEKTSDHPDIQMVQAEIERNQQQLRDALRVESATLTVRERELETNIQNLESEILEMPEKEMELARLQQVLAINRSVYETLKSRLEHLAVEQQSVANEYTIRVVDRAFVPPGRDQDWPLWSLNILAGLLLGFVFGVGGAFLLEYWNEPVLGARDVEQVLGLRFLGRFPELDNRDS